MVIYTNEITSGVGIYTIVCVYMCVCVYYDFIAEGFSLFCRLTKLDFYLELYI